MKRTIIACLVALTCALSLPAQQKEGTVYMVSNAHFDSQWNWDVQQSINVYIRNTLTQNLWLLENYPNYIFNFEGGVKYAWMKEYYPQEYAKIKKYVQNGRWHISGSSWDATDPNMPSSESFFRNILLGQQFYKDEFGVKSTDIFLPDCFGFGYTMPTIAAHCGLIGFSTQKLQWRQKPFYGDSKVPFTIGLWQGVDGSRILAAPDARNYTKKYKGEDISSDKEIVAIMNSAPDKMAMRYYGVGDVGGSPNLPSVLSINKGINGSGPVKIVSATSDRLFKEYLAKGTQNLPVFDGELLMDVHATGCYTSQAAMKLYNRRNEQLADAAERASVIAEWLNAADYPSQALTQEWQRFVWHQFHDDLTGTSIPAAYTFSWNDELIAQSRFADILASATAQTARALDTRTKGSPVVVFNPLSQQRKDMVYAKVPMKQPVKGVAVYSPSGAKVNSQLVSYNNGVAEVVFAADMAPTSYGVYDVRAAAPTASRTLKAGERTIENSVYKLTLDNNGDIGSIIDKRTSRELVEKGKAIRLALFTDNVSTEWPAWEVLKKTMDAAPKSIVGDVKISTEQTGTAKIALKVERKHGKSNFVQIISLTDGGADDRIDIENRIDWHEAGSLLKAEFPLTIANPKATYDLGIGSITRGNNTPIAYEVCAQQWADITATDNSCGVAVANNGRYGWDKPADNTLRLTLLHTPKTDKRYTYQDKQDFGYHTLTYSIVSHEGTPAQADIVRKADALNNPLYAFNSTKHEGTLGRSFSFVSSPADNIDIKAVKKAESGDYYVVRAYETKGSNTENAELVFNAPITEAKELNGIEEVIGDVKVDGNKIIFSTTAYRPKTFSVKFAAAKQPLSPVKATPLKLNYTSEAFSNDAFLGMMANFDGKGNSYSYDILPQQIVCDNVAFDMGGIEGRNVIKCQKDTIAFDKAPHDKTLYLLVASTDGDAKADFTVDGQKHSFTIPYYSGFYGQWGGFEQEFKGYVKDAKLAYVGSHRHNTIKGNEPYVYTYMYKIAIPLSADTKSVVLPDNKNVAVFAATIADCDDTSVTPAADFRHMSIK